MSGSGCWQRQERVDALCSAVRSDVIPPVSAPVWGDEPGGNRVTGAGHQYQLPSDMLRLGIGAEADPYGFAGLVEDTAEREEN